MNLVYIYLGGSRKHSSVQQKIINQINELNNCGVSAQGWFYSELNEVEEQLSENIILKPLQKPTKNYRLFNSYFRKNFMHQQIYNQLNQSNFDGLFIRHFGNSKNYFTLLKAFSGKIYLYMPSNPVSEGFQERKANKAGSITSVFLKWFEFFSLIYLTHQYLYKVIFPKLKAVVAYTPEFCDILRKKANNKATLIYNRDGVDCQRVPLRKIENEEEDVFKLIFLKGSAVQQPWAGLDRLIRSIEARQDLKFQLFICGNVIDKENYQFDFITLTGTILGNELDDLINKVDIGVSNLANYLIGFSETTNLKSRDYFARGLPFIQANTMPDVEGYSASKYYLNIENSNSLIDMDKVKNFILNMRLDKNHVIEMRRFAEERLDWKHTVKELAESIKSID